VGAGVAEAVRGGAGGVAAGGEAGAAGATPARSGIVIGVGGVAAIVATGLAVGAAAGAAGAGELAVVAGGATGGNGIALGAALGEPVLAVDVGGRAGVAATGANGAAAVAGAAGGAVGVGAVVGNAAAGPGGISVGAVRRATVGCRECEGACVATVRRPWGGCRRTVPVPAPRPCIKSGRVRGGPSESSTCWLTVTSGSPYGVSVCAPLGPLVRSRLVTPTARMPLTARDTGTPKYFIRRRSPSRPCRNGTAKIPQARRNTNLLWRICGFSARTRRGGRPSAGTKPVLLKRWSRVRS